MRRSRLAFTALLLPIDFILLILAGVAAYHLRMSPLIAELRPVLSEIPFGVYMALVAINAVIWLMIFAIAGLYRVERRSSVAEEFFSIILACSAGLVTVVIAIFFSRELFSSRFIVLAAWGFGILFVTLGRLIVRAMEYSFLSRGVGTVRVMLVGANEEAKRVVRALRTNPRHGYTIVGAIEHFGPQESNRLLSLKAHGTLEAVMVVDPQLPREELKSLIDFTHDNHLTFRYAADLLGIQSSHIDIHTVAGMPFIEVKRGALEGWGRILKRAVDVTVASVGLVVLAPIFLLIAAVITVDTPGPVLVSLPRVGQGGRVFTLIKFRSMVRGADKMKEQLMPLNERTGPLFKMANDPRITRAGRVLRKTFLDELPQLFNVLRGEMSLVGPRPHEEGEVKQYVRPYRQLLAVRPGMTGLAQVSGHSSLTFEEEARLDLIYIEHWSLALDISILLKTPWIILARPAV